jgi:hypothetical protein
MNLFNCFRKEFLSKTIHLLLEMVESKSKCLVIETLENGEMLTEEVTHGCHNK